MTPTPGILWRWPDGRTHRLSEYEVRVGTCALPGPNSRPDMRVVSDGSPDPTDPLTRLWLDAQAPSADEVGRAARITLDLGAPARAEGLDEARAALADCDAPRCDCWCGGSFGLGRQYEERCLLRQGHDGPCDPTANTGCPPKSLRHALAVADQLAGEVAQLRAEALRLDEYLSGLTRDFRDLREFVVPGESACVSAERMLRRLVAERARLTLCNMGLEGKAKRLEGELAEARKVGPRWERSEAVGETPEEWRLTIGGRLCVPDAKIVRPAGMPPVVWILGRSFGTLHEAARAVCTRLGLPLITEGLEVDRG